MKLKDVIIISTLSRIFIVVGCISLIFIRYSIGFKLNNGLPPLVSAAEKSDLSKVKKLLTTGYFVDQSDSDGNTPLHYATIFSDLEQAENIVHVLLKHYAFTGSKNNKGVSPVHNTVEIDDLIRRMKIIFALVLHGGKIANERDNLGFGLLERTIELQDKPGLEETLSWWGWLFSKDDIMRATEKAYYYNFGFTVNSMENFNQKKFIISSKLNLSPLIQAILSDDLTAVKKEINKASTQINNKENTFQLSPLHVAIAQSNPNTMEIITLLLTNNASLNNIDYRKATPLLMTMHLANTVLKKQRIAYLVEKGANINDQDANNDTLLHLAVKKNDASLVSFLLDTYKKSIQVNIKNKQGKTAKELARELNYGHIYTLF